MADPRFFENCGPFTLAQICERSGIEVPAQADPEQQICDLAGLSGAGPAHLSFFTGGAALKEAFARSHAGFCLVPAARAGALAKPATMTLLAAPSVPHAFAAIASLFYPQDAQPQWSQNDGISPDAQIAANVRLAPGVVIGPGVEIGESTRIGPGCVIGPGVAIGSHCELGAQISISHAYLGDRLLILPGAHIGQPGFGFASSPARHVKIPQLGRVIIQDEVEIGACATIDRGSLGDTVIGEGSKIDNLVMIGHNVQIGRHCVIAGQCGIAGSCIIEDFVVLGGQVGLGDHSKIGSGARLGARSATITGTVLPGGRDYGGVPAKPLREWIREIHAVNRLVRHRKQDDDG